MGAGATVSYNNEGGVIHNNSDAFHGGGVMMRDGRFTMNGGEIHSNTAQQEGGGVMASGEFTLTGGEITGNATGHAGEGVAVIGTIRSNYVIGVADESRGSIRNNSPVDVR